MLKELTSTQINALTPECLELLLKKSITQDDIDRLKKICVTPVDSDPNAKDLFNEFENMLRRFEDEIFYVEYLVLDDLKDYRYNVETKFNWLMTREEFNDIYPNINPDLISYSGYIYNDEFYRPPNVDEPWNGYRPHDAYYKGRTRINVPTRLRYKVQINLYALSYRNKNLRIIHPEMKKTAILLNRFNLLNQENKNTNVCNTTDENKNNPIKEKVVECGKSEDEDHCIEYQTSPNKSNNIDNFQDELLKVYRDGYNEYKNKYFELFESNNELLNENNSMTLLLAQHNIQYSSNKGYKNKNIINNASI
jgi:hypothetical protein